MEALGVSLVTSVNVRSIRKNEGVFVVETDDSAYEADAVVMAMGSEASVRDPKTHTAYEILRSFGHHVWTVFPALTPLFGDNGFEEFWDGVRVQATVTYGNEKETGEVQLTREGISGIPVFQVSHEAVLSLESRKRISVFLDFLPHYDAESLVGFLQEAKMKRYSGLIRDYLTGWLPKKLVFALSKGNEELFRKSLSSCAYEELAEVVEYLKRFRYEVTGAGTLAVSQVASGGLDTAEVTENLESRLVPGLFITGELLDIDGACGGYNLHFAFASGRIAGLEAAK